MFIDEIFGLCDNYIFIMEINVSFKLYIFTFYSLPNGFGDEFIVLLK